MCVCVCVVIVCFLSLYCTKHSAIKIVIYWGEPHHVRSTVKSVFLLACLLVCLSLPYMVEYNQKYIKSHLSVNHACCATLSVNHKFS